MDKSTIEIEEILENAFGRLMKAIDNERPMEVARALEDLFYYATRRVQRFEH